MLPGTDPVSITLLLSLFRAVQLPPPWAIPAHRLCELPRAIFLIIFSNVGFRRDKDLLQTFALFPSDIAHHSSSHQNNTFVDTLFFEGFLPSHRHLLQLTFPSPSFFAWRQHRVSTFSFLLFPFPLRNQTRAKTTLTPHSRETPRDLNRVHLPKTRRE